MINGTAPLHKLGQYRDLYVVIAVIMVVIMMVLPLPPFLLDILFACNISLSLLVLLLSINIREPLEISIFPTLLLLLTLFRLALSVSSTRLILLRAYAGNIISAFGDFVVGGNYIVGFVIFLILVIVQFIVITKGSERVAEVAARFTLDAMPGKQMSIDADLNAGLISEAEARQRRVQIQREADFYGAMDGASKFIKGDAIAGIIIVLIDFVGGLLIGILSRGYDFQRALNTYTLLTVGDGLVSQIPALLVSTATGIIVTRAASENNLGHDLNIQLLSSPKTLMITSGVLMVFAVVPGLPFVPFFILSGLFGLLGYALFREQASVETSAIADEARRELEERRQPDSVLSLLQVDMIELEIGYSLIPLVDSEQGGDMLDRITMIRRQCALELGIIVPVIRIRDNLQLPPNSYVIKIKGIEVGRGQLMLNHYLAMDAGNVTEPVPGEPTKEPAFGLDALWISEEHRERAEMNGYTVVDSPSVLATHLTETIRNHAHELLGRQEVQTLLDSLRSDYSAVINELVPNLMTIGEIQKVLQTLLREQVPIRNLVTILESLADAAPVSKDLDYLTEYVREALARQLCRQYAENDVLLVLTLEPQWETVIAEGIEQTERGNVISIDPRILQRLFGALKSALDANNLVQPVILVSPRVRLALRRLTERNFPSLIVLSYNEIVPEIQVQTVGVVKWPHED
ncbi:MAG: flagellar biosynthesis protein FlhA [Firmicutes bacterium]|jgi:flagellar biosynthesis protein FlhA|nr:flagellar biosynthesis protein FlhA [Bacillota bacterium]NLL88075.1 flagellar biosynthesis protein FlhA [Bacillota bacterium]HKM18044.1 flagellar biosynthesis protein FlhA [Limnochordia bacterium]